ncbi:MAG: LuxR C-terminal-related transcriptional regulator [Tenuifilaceae bacterium]|nr:LuxR C-terminal-related transcriptional regulator [Tenuifilaceae bacterium]
MRHYKQLKAHLSSISQKINKHNLCALTKTQVRIITLLCEGKSVRQIAENLNRSFHTVDNHKRTIFKKLGINKMQHLVAFAKENGLV